MNYLVSGDTGAGLQVQLLREKTGDILDLTNVTVIFKFRSRGSDTVLFTVLGVCFTPEQATSGISIIQFGDNLIGLSTGQYEGEVSIIEADLTIETVYELIYFQVREEF